MCQEPRSFTFVNTSDAFTANKTHSLSQINSHIAKVRHQRRRREGDVARRRFAGYQPSREPFENQPESKACVSDSTKDNTDDLQTWGHWSLAELEGIFDEFNVPTADSQLIGTRDISEQVIRDPWPDNTIVETNEAAEELSSDNAACPTLRKETTSKLLVTTTTIASLQKDALISDQTYCTGMKQTFKLKQNHNTQSHALSKPKYWTLPNPHQIRSSLDPFVRLPLDVSEREQSLLQFFLTDGRRMLFGTSENPLYCPAFDVASRALQNCPVFVQTHLVMAEHLLCSLSPREKSASFYKRLAGSYRTANDLIVSRSASFDSQLSGLLHLQMVDWTIQRPELQSMHLRAMDHLVEAMGGLSIFQKQRKDGTDLAEPMFYTNQFMLAEFEIAELEVLNAVSVRFIQSLRRIQAWTRSVQGLESTVQISGDTLHETERKMNLIKFKRISDYLHTLINVWLRDKDLPHAATSGVFHLLYNLAITFTEYNFDAVDAEFLLESMQYHMDKSTLPVKDGENFANLQACAAVSMLSYVRRKLAPVHDKGDSVIREIAICRASIDSLKIFPLLSVPVRLHLCRNLAKCALVIVARTEVEFFNEPELEDLSLAIREAWTTLQTSNT